MAVLVNVLHSSSNSSSASSSSSVAAVAACHSAACGLWPVAVACGGCGGAGPHATCCRAAAAEAEVGGVTAAN
jgi:hypothetical protein